MFSAAYNFVQERGELQTERQLHHPTPSLPPACMEPATLAALAERARSLNFAPPCWEALGVVRASSLAFEAHWAAADEVESACSTAEPEEPEEPDLAQGVAVTARDLSDALRSCLSDARFRWVTDARPSAAEGCGATFLWDATSRSWADRASGEGGACSAQWGSSFGLSEDWLTVRLCFTERSSTLL